MPFYRHRQGRGKDMKLNAGETIQYRLKTESRQYNATVITIDDDRDVLHVQTEEPYNISKGQHLVLSNIDMDFYTEVIGIEGTMIRLKRLSEGKREYFRVDDTLPLIARKVEEDLPLLKSRILSGFGVSVLDEDMPDEEVNQPLWKMLVHINTKLNLILDKLNLKCEGLKAEKKQVNISASGIRITLNEKPGIGDLMEIKMLIPECPPVGVLVYGSVVRVRELNSHEHEVSIHFSDMDDDVRDVIIHYALKRQREIINKQRENNP